MKKIILFALVAITLASCSTPKTMGEQYAAMYDEKPVAIAVMPPINRTTHAEAKDFSIPRCICLSVKKVTTSILPI